MTTTAVPRSEPDTSDASTSPSASGASEGVDGVGDADAALADGGVLPGDPAPAGAAVPGDGEPGGGSPGGRSAPAGRSLGAWRLVAVAGIVGTLVFGVAWWNGRDAGSAVPTASSGPAAQLLAAARTFSLTLTNFDGATVDRDFDRITAQSTGEFKTQAAHFFSGDVRTQLKAAQASSRGEIRSSFVETASDGRGTVFVVVDQTIANNKSPEPQADTLRMELQLTRQGKVWLVDQVTVLTAPAAGATTPAAGGTASTSPSGSPTSSSSPTSSGP